MTETIKIETEPCHTCAAHGIVTPATTVEPAVEADDRGGLARTGAPVPLCDSCAAVAREYPDPSTYRTHYRLSPAQMRETAAELAELSRALLSAEQLTDTDLDEVTERVADVHERLRTICMVLSQAEPVRHHAFPEEDTH